MKASTKNSLKITLVSLLMTGALAANVAACWHSILAVSVPDGDVNKLTFALTSCLVSLVGLFTFQAIRLSKKPISSIVSSGLASNGVFLMIMSMTMTHPPLAEARIWILSGGTLMTMVGFIVLVVSVHKTLRERFPEAEDRYPPDFPEPLASPKRSSTKPHSFVRWPWFLVGLSVVALILCLCHVWPDATKAICVTSFLFALVFFQAQPARAHENPPTGAPSQELHTGKF